MERDIHHKQTLVNIEDEMKKSYMDYAMSVIIGPGYSRCCATASKTGAPPDFYMPCMKWATAITNPTKNPPYRRRDQLGKYHPHGDAAIYDTMVRMAQDFRCATCWSTDRAISVRLTAILPRPCVIRESAWRRISDEVLADLEKERSIMCPTMMNPSRSRPLLATRIPLLLLNGTSGIAVGMATNIPPHNLKEIISGTIACIKNPDITIEQLMRHIPGPDFPTAGFINGREGILSAYKRDAASSAYGGAR